MIREQKRKNSKIFITVLEFYIYIKLFLVIPKEILYTKNENSIHYKIMDILLLSI